MQKELLKRKSLNQISIFSLKRIISQPTAKIVDISRSLVKTRPVKTHPGSLKTIISRSATPLILYTIVFYNLQSEVAE